MTRNAVFAAVAFFLSFALLFVIAEVGLRIWKHDLAFQPDPDLIRSLRPNINYNVVSYETDDNLNGRSDEIPSQPAVIGTSPTNNLGLRMTVDIEPKRANEKRVLIFGDSYTEAIQVDARDRFSYLADLKLQEATGGEWRIINGAIMNGNPDQYLMMLRRFQETIDPDMVVIVLAPNDTEDGMHWDERYGFVRDKDGAPLHPETQGWLALTRSSFVIRSFYAILEGPLARGTRVLFPKRESGQGAPPMGPSRVRHRRSVKGLLSLRHRHHTAQSQGDFCKPRRGLRRHGNPLSILFPERALLREALSWPEGDA